MAVEIGTDERVDIIDAVFASAGKEGGCSEGKEKLWTSSVALGKSVRSANFSLLVCRMGTCMPLGNEADGIHPRH